MNSTTRPTAIDTGSRALPAGFNRLAWSNLAAQSAEQVALAAAPIVAVVAFGAGAGETGFLQTAQTLPYLLFAIPAGVLADRLSRRRLLAAAEALRALSLAAILLCAQQGVLSLGLLAALGFLGACGTVAYSVVAPALVPALVPRGLLPAANARIELARTVAFACGPAVAGALVGWAGAGPAFAFATALSVCAVFLLAGLGEPERAPVAARNPLREVAEGARFVLGHPLLAPVFATQVVFNAAFFMLQAMYVPYAMGTLGLSAGSVGATLAALGIGMVAGALLATQVAKRVSFGTLVAIGPLCGVASALAMLFTLWVPSAWLAALSFFLIGAGPAIWVIATGTLRQAVTPARLLGRVSAMFTLAQGARPLGAAIGGFIGAGWGPPACLAAIVGGFLLQAAMILLSPAPRLARLPGGQPGEAT